ncbi:uncharacterized protein LOC132169694 [Corylus avellana]|uniref:uncharacterized protein LOC132169694 n=1 Tax=Corylus avellana TaxID=13451 RepID=UPI00286B8599|nr:uncharacterized protein LOC132169694 [Corylus avellana]
MAIAEEVEKLLKARFIEEVYYPDWLANVVLVKKCSGKWRICVDFTDLNKACPKDSFPLPRIDVLVDSTAGCSLLSFMDAFSGYNQIYMHPEDQEKAAFITDRGLYCYMVMPFGLKNAGATYQRLVNKMFRDQIGSNMEVYVDDMLVKSMLPEGHIEDLQETFGTLKKYGMKLNPAKCAFGVASKCEEAFEQLTSTPLLSRTVPGEALYLYLAVSPTAETTPVFLSSHYQSLDRVPIEENAQKKDETWVVYVDGSSTRKNGGAGVVLITPDGEELCSSLRLEFKTTNNEAEYEAVLAGLGLAREMGANFVELRSDSQVIVGHIRGEFEAKRDKMKQYLSKEEGDYVLREIHEGICGSHSGARVLAHKAVRAGFYWPNMNRDSVQTVRNCDKCQRFANIAKQPPEDLSSISSPWPFSQWRVDIVGPLPRGKGGVCFTVVAVDYFTKWAEVEALVNITAKSIERFLWKNVVCHYGIPHAFVTDNGKQFDCESFREWCAKLHIRNYYSSPAHPQANGQVEVTNKTIFKMLKKKLGDQKGNWADDLPEVLWAYRTTKRIPTEESPYALAFGTEAVIPAEIGSGSYRVESFYSETNNEGLKLHLDLLQEK